MFIIPNKFCASDIQERVDWINNELINSTMFFDLPASHTETKKWFEANVDSKSRVDFTFKNDTGVCLAMGGLTGISQEHQNAEFYVMVNPDLHGKGIGKEVSLWIYNYGFSILKLHKIYLYTNDDNVSAYHIYEKAGFQLEGVLRQHKLKNGQFQNRRFYGLLNSEWIESEWGKKVYHEI